VSAQRYVSKELTHFVGRGRASPEEQYEVLVEILRSGWLTHPPHNPCISGNLEINPEGRFTAGEMYNPQVVCFCDIPVDDLSIHTAKYSRFGLSFLKEFLIDRGANPVFYVSQNTMVFPKELHGRKTWAELYDEWITDYASLMAEIQPRTRAPDMSMFQRVMRFRRFLDFFFLSYVKAFDARHTDEDPENFYMEREWRMLGNLRFDLGDVYRVLIPEGYAPRLGADVPGYAAQITNV
jgi:hypothetical protein